MEHTKKSAFTLVELLTVLAITLILASLFLPSLAHARERAQRARCVSNQRQLMLAWMMYSDDTGKIASNGYIQGGGEEATPMWVQGYYNHNVTIFDSTNSTLLLDARFAQFSGYIRDVKIYKCPSDRKVFTHVRRGIQFTKLRSYSMNGNMGWVDFGPWQPKGQIFYQDSSILSPSETLAFLDVHPESICWPFFGVESYDAFFMVPALHHNGAAMLSYADGHVAARRWTDPRTTQSPEEMAWHDHHYMSPGNKDLKWLRNLSSQ